MSPLWTEDSPDSKLPDSLDVKEGQAACVLCAAAAAMYSTLGLWLVLFVAYL